MSDLRDKMKNDSKATLIYEWDHPDGDTFRLVAVGKYTKGFDDYYVIEELSSDSLGEPQWVFHARIDRDHKVAMLLLSAIRSVVKG